MPERRESELLSNMKLRLEEDGKTADIYMYNCLESTNTTLKNMAKAGAGHGTVVIAKEQTAGRGRFGRKFFSPADTGLYMSILMDVEETGISDISLLTCGAAVITLQAIEGLTGIKCGIKWVNDLYIESKKVCGILAEGVVEHTTGKIKSVVVGIGINIDTKCFPDEIENIATSIYKENTTANPKDLVTLLAMDITKRFMSDDVFKNDEEYMSIYRENQILIGKNVTVHGGSEVYEAKVVDVDSKGRLIVEKSDGVKENLFSGEVSVKMEV